MLRELGQPAYSIGCKLHNLDTQSWERSLSAPIPRICGEFIVLGDQFSGYAVFDIETTGLFPGRNDRIIEIGIVRLDEEFDVVEEWETLINPDRDIGETDVHGLTAGDLRDAPTFSELIADIWHRFEGTIPVAHNFNFDRKFIISEFAHAGVDLPEFDGLCTMRLSDKFGIGGGCRKLVDICRYLALPTGDAHSAGHDAKMASEILLRASQIVELPQLASPVTCPELWKRDATPLGITRQKARAAPIETPLQQMAGRLNGSNVLGTQDDGAVDEYLLVLDRVLEDRVVDDSEAEELVSYALETGLSADTVAQVHHNYLEKLVALVLADGIVTDDEHRDLVRVAGLLGLEKSEVESLLQKKPAPLELLEEDLSGKTVCFTGSSKCSIDGDKLSKKMAESFAINAGLTPKPSVTKQLDILVVADPDTASGKAKKARDYGIRIIAERSFWSKLGIAVD